MDGEKCTAYKRVRREGKKQKPGSDDRTRAVDTSKSESTLWPESKDVRHNVVLARRQTSA